MDSTRTERAGALFYILCCLIALLCFGWSGLSEALVLEAETDAQVRVIDQAVAKMDKVARK